MRRGFVISALLWAGSALAEPVSLPTGEDPAVWTEPLRLAGLHVGPRNGGAGVEIVPRGTTWVVRVSDTKGHVQITEIPAPRTEHDREDLAWLARSLLTPAQGASWGDLGAPPDAPRVAVVIPPPPTPVAPPPAKPTPTRTTPKPTAPPAAAPAPVAAVPAPTPAPPAATPAAPAPAPIAAPPVATVTIDPVRSGPRPYGEAGGTLAWRPDTSLAGTIRGGGGLRVAPLRIGALVEWSPARSLAALGEDRRVASVDLTAGVAVTPLPWLDVGVRAGASHRDYSQDGLAIATWWYPVVVGAVDVPIAVTSALRITPFVEATFDLRSTQIRVAETDMDDLTGVELRAGASVWLARFE